MRIEKKVPLNANFLPEQNLRVSLYQTVGYSGTTRNNLRE